MTQNRGEWELELEESAQGVDLFEAPGAAAHEDSARVEAEDWSSGVADSGDSPPRVERARARRHSLGDALTALEQAVAKPAAVGGWLDAVSEAIDELRRALEEHIEVTEGLEGLLAEIQDVAPRLSGEVDLIKAEHDELLEALERAELTVSGTRSISSEDPEPIRRRVMTLLGRLSQHRQRGADLVYEAYNVDIATAD